jgi:hypothetical protein
MSLNDPAWASFYQQASLQNVIDPALVVAIARSETGDNLAHNGMFTLGIDVRGAGGSGGSNLTVGNATHTFYAYSSGLQAAQGLAGFLNANSRYGNASSLFHDPAGLLQRLQDNGYSGCPGPECDPIWNLKIMQIRTAIISAFSSGGDPAGTTTGASGGGDTPGGSPGNPQTNKPSTNFEPSGMIMFFTALGLIFIGVGIWRGQVEVGRTTVLKKGPVKATV